MSVFDDLGVLRKLAIPSSLKFWTYDEWSLGSRDARSCEQRPPKCFSMPEGHFLIEIPAKQGKILAIRELNVLAALVLFLKVQDLRINSQWVGKNLYAKVTSPGENVSDFQHNFLLTFISFPAHGWRSSRCRFSMILVSLESLRYLIP